MPSFGQAYRLTQRAQDKDVLLAAAASLATRYNAKVGVITTGDWNPAWRAPMVIDTMMNLELLLWAAQNGGKPEWREMAVSHALKTLSDLIRADGGSYQVVDYEPTTGQIRSRGTYQGYSDSSTWSRGQAWAIYGFTMVYRYTRDPRMLDAARKVADYYLGRLPPDLVPKWDLDAPDETKDSSTAAAVASALLELSGFVDATTGARYRDVALRTLDSLASPAYLSDGTNSEGLLLHGTGDYPAKQGVDASLIYGDYYFLEAVLRARALGAPATPAPSEAAPGAEADAGTPPPPQPTGSTPPPETGGCSEGFAAGSILGGPLAGRTDLAPAPAELTSGLRGRSRPRRSTAARRPPGTGDRRPRWCNSPSTSRCR